MKGVVRLINAIMVGLGPGESGSEIGVETEYLGVQPQSSKLRL